MSATVLTDSDVTPMEDAPVSEKKREENREREREREREKVRERGREREG